MKQPKALYLLNFVSMWECFSYYGMRVLLVLFMSHELGFSDTQAFGLYALYTTLVEFGGVLGGRIADRFLGLPRAISLGGWTIALGHLCLAVSNFYLGLGLIIAGTCLFRSNIAAFVGDFYEEEDPRREAGYTIYYTGINIGGFLAAVLCGYVGEVYGFHAGFGLAAIGMLAGNIALITGSRLLKNPRTSQKIASIKASLTASFGLLFAGFFAAACLLNHTLVTPCVPIVALGIIVMAIKKMKDCTSSEKQGLKKLALAIFSLIIFYGCEEQLGSTLVLFAERHVERVTAFGTIPAASLITFNPLTILLLGPLVARILQRTTVSDRLKIQVSFLLLASSFCLLYFASMQATESVPLTIAIGSVVLIGASELLIGPTVFAIASKVAPVGFQGLIMGMVTLGFSLASLFSGVLSQMMAITEETNSLSVYTYGFGIIGLVALTIPLMMQFKKKALAT